VLHVVQLAVHYEVIIQLYPIGKIMRIWRNSDRIANEEKRNREEEEEKSLSELEFVLVPPSCNVLSPAHKFIQFGATCTNLSVGIKLRKHLAVYIRPAL
jgi:hypothetical protein